MDLDFSEEQKMLRETVRGVCERHSTVEIVRKMVDEIVTLPDAEIFDAVLWVMHHAKLVVEGAAAAPVGALLKGLIRAPAGARVVAVLSGGNVDLEQLRGLKWN